MFGRGPRLAHSHQGDEQHPLRRQAGITVVIAILLAIIALLLLPPHAHGNFVYWTNDNPVNSIGRAKINGTGANTAFISGLADPRAVAVDSRFIYWTQSSSIGRASLDGSGVNPNFITTGVTNPTGIAVTATGIYWVNTSISADRVGHANLDGSDPVPTLFFADDNTFGLAADQNFIYWLHSSGPSSGRIGRAALSGANPDINFITGIGTNEGLAVDPSFIYWTNYTTGIGRVPIGGGTPDPNFIPNASTNPAAQRGVAVNPQYVFWSDADNARIGRANIDGTGVNTNLAPASGQARMMAAAPSNKITITSIVHKKKKGTAVINAKVPGPGQVTLNQTPGTQDPNATAAAIKQIGLTITGASTFKLPVKPKGKTAKKLKKQVAKKGKGKVKVTVFITFVPAGVAGVPNSELVKVKLIKRGKRRK